MFIGPDLHRPVIPAFGVVPFILLPGSVRSNLTCTIIVPCAFGIVMPDNPVAYPDPSNADHGEQQPPKESPERADLTAASHDGPGNGRTDSCSAHHRQCGYRYLQYSHVISSCPDFDDSWTALSPCPLVSDAGCVLLSSSSPQAARTPCIPRESPCRTCAQAPPGIWSIRRV